MSFNTIIHFITVIILPLLFAITLHEAAHGWVASKLGDKTALMMGRVTLNPIKHLDLFGTIIIPIFMLIATKFTLAFGWAKPVPVTWQNLKKPRRDMALVAIAGPGANLIMAFFWAAIAKIAFVWGAGATSNAALEATKFFYLAGLYGVNINILLMILNLIPIPPLDGSRIVSSILPPRMAHTYEKIEPYGIWILLALLVFGILGRVLYVPMTHLSQFIRTIFGL